MLGEPVFPPSCAPTKKVKCSHARVQTASLLGRDGAAGVGITVWVLEARTQSFLEMEDPGLSESDGRLRGPLAAETTGTWRKDMHGFQSRK